VERRALIVSFSICRDVHHIPSCRSPGLILSFSHQCQTSTDDNRDRCAHIERLEDSSTSRKFFVLMIVRPSDSSPLSNPRSLHFFFLPLHSMELWGIGSNSQSKKCRGIASCRLVSVGKEGRTEDFSVLTEWYVHIQGDACLLVITIYLSAARGERSYAQRTKA
jgi:hypothetical protein